MIAQGSGVILTLTGVGGRAPTPLLGGMGPAWAAVEGLTRSLAAELGPQGIRVICLRPYSIPETPVMQDVYTLRAQVTGMTREQVQSRMESMTLLRRLPTLAQVADVAAFMASDHASAMTGTVANLSGGLIVD